MKKWNFVLMGMFVALVAFSQGNKNALLIAIGDYDKEKTGWGPISSGNDVEILADALKYQGFPPERITILNSNATKARILKAFSEFTARLDEGGIAFVHFSSHGQQIYDDSGDEPDGYDEAIIPIDARTKYIKGVYSGQNHLRDDTLNKLFLAIRKKLGPHGQLVASMDACHSGSTMRSLTPEKVRGLDKPFAPPGYNPNEKPDPMGAFDMGGKPGTAAESQLASYVAFFGSGSNELNYEYNAGDTNYGSLSYALSKHLKNAGPQTTYKGLFDKIQAEMAVIARNQTPMAEGTLNMLVFGGVVTDKTRHFNIKKVLDDNEIIINAGTFSSVYQGAQVAVYPPDTRDTAGVVPEATGKIIQVGALESLVHLDRKVNFKGRAAWVFIRGNNYPGGKIALALLKLPPQVKKDLTTAFSNIPNLSIADSGPYDLVFSENAQRAVCAFDRYGNLLYTENKTYEGPLSKQLMDNCIKPFYQANMLRKLEEKNATSNAVNCILEVIPVQVDSIFDENRGRYRFSFKSYVNIEDKINQGKVELRNNDYFILRVTNLGKEDLCFSILEIQPDNKVNILVPRSSRNEKGDDYCLLPNQVWEEKGRIYRVTPPFGLNEFKLVASNKPLDLTGIEATRGASGGNKSFFENCFSRSYDMTRSDSVDDGNVDLENRLIIRNVNVLLKQ